MKRLNDVLGTNQIFTRIMSQHTLPWATDSSVSAALLDFEYRYNFSGNKITAPAVDKSLGDDGIITSAAFNTLCDVAYMMYGKKWARYWEVLTAEFDPIKNYDMRETLEGANGNLQTHAGTDTDRHTGTDTLTQTGTDTNVRTGTDTNVKTGSHSDAHSGSTTDSGNRNVENEVSAFNSSTYQDNTKDTETNGNTRTHNDTITTTYNNETDTRTYGSLTDQQTKNLTDRDTKDLTDSTQYGHTITDAGTESHILTRSGNIGVTTSQQMLESSLELWKWNFFYDVFKDIDSVFTISTY